MIKQELLDELRSRKAKAFAGGGAERIAKRHSRGLLSARERVDELFDSDSFQESGALVEHDCNSPAFEGRSMPGDGVITGVGYVDGRPVSAFSQDFTVGGGALGHMHSLKISDAMDRAGELGMPFVAINDSGGARIQEGVNSLSGYGQVFYRNVYLSGIIPQIAIIAGPCMGGAAYSPALMDFLIMTKQNATNMCICGPEVIRAATGQVVTAEEVGSADMHATISGNIHFVANDDKHALQITRKLLSFLPSNNMQDPPHNLSSQITLEKDEGMNEIVPEENRQPLDIYKVIERLVDAGDFLEVQKDFAKNIVVGFARIDGVVVGIIGNQPTQKAGTLDIDASDKGARFIRFCNAFNVPIVTLVDVPGFLPGVKQEQFGIIRHGAKMLFAYAAATVPKITVILRKAYGGAYLAMCSKDMGADFVYAWPTAEIAVMGAEGAIRVIFKDQIKNAADPKAKEAELLSEYRSEFASPYQAAKYAMIDDVIEPSETRATVSLALRTCLKKRVTRPPKKHGLIPL